ncbi:DUF4376 domain-containing protein [Salinicola sp. LHM]|uniref:DUF4376 domain-containing protein n=1 Tax=Salinicola sp. LHM TaxID=3065298 RepID=UPI002ACD99DF|nr:DUF4376 domain-containing protein [Salinicola sp. LHM]WQH33364.1 DUF4376 domain-containing protein [Salinicola sp. LHM]
MTRYARITDDNKCAEFIDFEPQGRFHPSIRWLEVPEALERWVGHDYIAIDDEIQPPSLDHLRGQLKTELASIRFARETAGVILPDGSKVRTDRESQAQVNSAYTTLRDGFLPTADFKGANGWVAITLEEITPIAKAVAQHVQPCFTAERRVSEQQIDAVETLDELLAIDLEAAFVGELEAAKATATAAR